MDSIHYQSAVTDALLRLGQIIENLSVNQQAQGPHDSKGHQSIPRPPIYHGYSNENVSTWIFQLESYFNLRGISGLHRLSYLPSFLDKHALLWFQQLMQAITTKSRTPYDTWEDFLEDLKHQFLPANLQQLLRKRLRYLKQKGHVLEYTNQFRGILSQISSMQEDDKINYYIEGLQPAAKNELYYRNPQYLEEAINIANSFYSSSVHPLPTRQFPNESRAPMELGSIKATSAASKQSYYCSFCRKRGHNIEYCREKAKKDSKNNGKFQKSGFKALNNISEVEEDDCEEATISSIAYLNSMNGAKGKLLEYQGTIDGHPARFLIDSGASHDYLSQSFSDKHNFKTIASKSPIKVALADGSISEISQKSSNVKINIQGFGDDIIFHIFTLSPLYDAILGKPWLFRNNPAVDWRKNKIMIERNGEIFSLLNLTFSPSLYPQLDSANYNVLTNRQMSKQPLDNIMVVSIMDESEFLGETSSSLPEPVKDLLKQFQDVFPQDLPGLPISRKVKHKIETVSENPIFKASYRMSPKELIELKKQIDDLLGKGFIQVSSSPWGAPVLFAKKKDGSLRLCTDYRALNSVTIKNRYQIPRIDEILDSLHGAKVFSKIDLRSGYFQIAIEESDIPKTAFTTKFGHFEYKVMPFGLCNAPSTFMTLMNSIFHDIINVFVAIYLDDILIYSRNFDEHIQHLNVVFKRLRENKLYGKLSKCEFLKDSIHFLGHKISSEGIAVDQEKVQAVLKIPRPTKLNELLSFLGLVGYYRKFIPDFANHAYSLFALTKKDQEFKWREEHEQSFEKLKSLMVNAPVLQPPDFSIPFLVSTDASIKSVAGILSQDFGQGYQPVCYESHKLNLTEQNYPVHELEAYAIYYCFRQWRCYLEGSKVIVQTDHASLKYLMSQKHLSRRLARWMEYLQQFDLEIQYKPGRENVAADALSRLCVIDSEWPDYLFEFLSDGTIPENLDDEIKSKIRSESQNFTMENDVLYFTKDNCKIPYVPFIYRADLISKYHKSLGHMSPRDLYQVLKRKIYWPNFKKDLFTWLRLCPNCQLSASDGINSSSEPLHPFSPVPAFYRWGLDFIGKLPKSANGNQYIIVAIDHTTKWPVVKAVKSCDSETVANFLKSEIFLNYGCPMEIVTDRGAAFQEQTLRSYLDAMKVQHYLTSAYHPRSNGTTERFNGLFGKILHKYCATNSPKNWENYIENALLACRVRAHRATGYSSFFLVYGADPRIPGDISIPTLQELDEIDLVGERLKEINSLGLSRKDAIRNLENQKVSMKEVYDSKLRQKETIGIGSYVILKNMSKRKFEPLWYGPFKVKAMFPLGTFELEDLKGNKLKSRIHRDRIRPARVKENLRKPWKQMKYLEKEGLVDKNNSLTAGELLGTLV